MTLTAAAELGLTVFLLTAGSEMRTWAGPKYSSLLTLLCLEAVWTLLFTVGYMFWVIDGGARLLANVASSIIWLLLTAALWGLGAGIMHTTRARSHCSGKLPISKCRESLTVEALGWTEFALCAITLITTIMWMATRIKANARDSRTLV